MRIAFIHQGYFFGGGGAELHCRREAEALAARGHSVTIVTDAPAKGAGQPLKAPSGCDMAFFEAGLRIQSCAKQLVKLSNVRGFYRTTEWMKRHTRVGMYAAKPAAPALSRLECLREQDVICLMHSSSTPLLWNIQPVLARRARRYVTVALPLLHPREMALAPGVFKKLHAGFDVVNTSTEYESRYLTNNIGMTNKMVVTGVGSDEFREPVAGGTFRRRHGVPPAAPLVLFLGRKIFNKGVTHVIEAMNRVWGVYPGACLALVGFSHNPSSWLKGCLSKTRYGLSDQVVNLDDVSIREREEALAACDIMAAPSVSDSFGIVYLDAWRHRKPVIGCRNTCCESFIEDGVNGWLVDFGNTEQIADAILNVFGNRALAGAMGEQGCQKWKRCYTWEIIAAGMEKLAQEALDERTLHDSF
ncbi:MAG: glycosyltransferase family 4 protein [Kiritimatiellia bacterium]